MSTPDHELGPWWLKRRLARQMLRLFQEPAKRFARTLTVASPTGSAPIWRPLQLQCLRKLLVPGQEGEERPPIVMDPTKTEEMKAVNTRRQLRRWKHRRKRDGGKDRKFRLKYG